MTKKKTRPSSTSQKPCARCREPFTFAQVGFVCGHFAEGHLRTYSTTPGDQAFPDTSCTLCDFQEGSTLYALCRACWEALCQANVQIDEQDRERGYALAPRRACFEVLSIHRPGRCAIEKGGSVKLGFSRIPTTEDRWFEQMWVKVTGEGQGLLDNQPVAFAPEVLREGSAVSFTDDQVLQSRFEVDLVELPTSRRRELPRGPDDDDNRRLLADVSKYGWHLVYIHESEEGEAFAFTVGLHHSFGHPEVLVRGLEMDVAQAVLTRIANDVRDGKGDRPRTDLIHGATCTQVPFPVDQYGDFLGYASWFYRGTDFPAVELRWRAPPGVSPRPVVRQPP